MRWRRAAGIGAGLLAIALTVPETAAASYRQARVMEVVDGDTVEAQFKRRSIDIRLLGVDTPETVHPTEPVECFGPEASRFTEWKLEGESVRLEFDVERYDRYDRTLAYVWLKGRLFNRTLVRRGFATVLIYSPNDKYAPQLERAEDKARAEKRGLWGACKESEDGGPGGGGARKCDPSYPDVCISPPPPDLDCADVKHRNFRVRGSDPHRFDGNRDGWGCES